MHRPQSHETCKRVAPNERRAKTASRKLLAMGLKYAPSNESGRSAFFFPGALALFIGKMMRAAPFLVGSWLFLSHPCLRFFVCFLFCWRVLVSLFLCEREREKKKREEEGEEEEEEEEEERRRKKKEEKKK